MSLRYKTHKMEYRDIKDVLINKSLPEAISSLTNIKNELESRGIDLNKCIIDDGHLYLNDVIDYYIEISFPVRLTDEELFPTIKL